MKINIKIKKEGNKRTKNCLGSLSSKTGNGAKGL